MILNFPLSGMVLRALPSFGPQVERGGGILLPVCGEMEGRPDPPRDLEIHFGFEA